MNDVEERFGSTFGGLTWTTGGRTITTTDVLNFAGVSGDFAQLHVNDTFASSTIYGTTIAHGLLTLVVTTTLTSAVRTFPARASYGYERLRFVRPVFPGDTLSARVTVGEYRPRADGQGLVEMAYETVNQHGKTVMVCKHLLLGHPDEVFLEGVPE